MMGTSVSSAFEMTELEDHLGCPFASTSASTACWGATPATSYGASYAIIAVCTVGTVGVLVVTDDEGDGDGASWPGTEWCVSPAVWESALHSIYIASIPIHTPPNIPIRTSNAEKRKQCWLPPSPLIPSTSIFTNIHILHAKQQTLSTFFMFLHPQCSTWTF